MLIIESWVFIDNYDVLNSIWKLANIFSGNGLDDLLDIYLALAIIEIDGLTPPDSRLHWKCVALNLFLPFLYLLDITNVSLFSTKWLFHDSMF